MKLPDPAAQTAKYVNMMNATKQQEAAERQAMMAQETLDLKKKEDVREEAKQGLTITKMQQENAIQALTMFRDAVGDIDENDINAKEAVRADLVSRVPGYDKFLPPASQWTGDRIKRLMMDSAKEIDKLYATPIASVAVNDRTGQTTSITAGGLDPRAEVIGEVAPRTPTPPPMAAPQAAPQQTTPGPIPVGKYGEARVIPDNARPLTPDQQDHIRRLQEELGMANTPASFTRGGMGQMSPDMVPAIIDSAMKTGVMAQIDLDQMLAMTPPQARQGIVDVLRSNKVSLQADAPSLVTSAMNQQQPMAPNPVGRQQSQFADMRGPAPQASFADLGSAPPVQNTMAQSQGRTPFIARRESPAPGIYGVPTGQVAATSQAQRPSPAETAANETAKIGAQTKARLAEEDRLKTKGKKLFSSVLNDLRNDYQKLNRMKAIPSIERGGFENVGDYIGASRVGRMAQSAVGARASVPLNTISNSKLTLFNALKEATGLTSTQLNSNVELMTYLDSLADPTQGFESAMETIRRLENLYGVPAANAASAPAAAPRAATKTPVIPTLTPEQVRANPKIKRWKRSDNGEIMVRK
jgi:hypothetical protein